MLIADLWPLCVTFTLEKWKSVLRMTYSLIMLHIYEKLFQNIFMTEPYPDNSLLTFEI
jgi:hypothetical protein